MIKIIADKNLVALINASTKELNEIPDSITQVIFNQTTSPDVISRLGEMKPNIKTAYLSYELTDAHLSAMSFITIVKIDSNTSIRDLQALPESITNVYISKSTLPATVSALGTNIQTLYLGPGLPPTCVQEIPDSVTTVGINGSTPIRTIYALSNKPRVNKVLLGCLVSPKHVDALPKSIEAIEIYKNTPLKAIHQLANKENITVAFLNNVDDLHIDALPSSIKSIVLDRKTIRNVTDDSLKNLRDKEKENKSTPEEDKVTFFRSNRSRKRKRLTDKNTYGGQSKFQKTKFQKTNISPSQMR